MKNMSMAIPPHRDHKVSSTWIVEKVSIAGTSDISEKYNTNAYKQRYIRISGAYCVLLAGQDPEDRPCNKCPKQLRNAKSPDKIISRYWCVPGRISRKTAEPTGKLPAIRIDHKAAKQPMAAMRCVTTVQLTDIAIRT